ncbi:hypothetical protein SE92_05800 [Bradyrhizobium sp. AT1]|uniref:hypothetical protein n=1 Tax=Bradyrhizobium sp. AT1 TaxID=574934 RepID=UPI000794E067|nr:hypothetical protein [Bradyrhizobium sp. AT1]KYG19839.1 hypothetical protein SE92_05800 [Bradyrhizobium sp. AT1]
MPGIDDERGNIVVAFEYSLQAAPHGLTSVALVLSIAAAKAIFRFKLGMLTALAGSRAAGVALKVGGGDLGSILTCTIKCSFGRLARLVSRQPLRSKTLVVFMKLRIGLAIRDGLPRCVRVLRLAVGLIGDLLLG